MTADLAIWLVALHLALDWKWIVNTTRRLRLAAANAQTAACPAGKSRMKTFLRILAILLVITAVATATALGQSQWVTQQLGFNEGAGPGRRPLTTTTAFGRRVARLNEVSS
ncbi:MAG: hypothetical protein R3D55_06620 [Chloroflexota bacterium]